MNKYTAVIVGGGVAGLSCALTLASSKGFQKLPQDIKILVLDEGNSDLKKAVLYNVPLAEEGIEGSQLLAKIASQISKFGNTDLIEDKVEKIEGTKGNIKVTTVSGNNYEAHYAVIATGMQKFDITGEGLTALEHDMVAKPGKVKLKTDDSKLIRDGIYAAGLVAGEPTMFACASGSGVSAACKILSDIQGKLTVIHDTAKSRV